MAIVFALSLLWAAFEDEKLKSSPAPEEASTQVPKTVALLHPAFQHRIIRSYKSAFGELPHSISNPVMKIPIVPQGYGDQLYITKLLTEDDGPAERERGECPAGTSRSGGSCNQLAFSTSWWQLYGVNDCNVLGQQLSTQRRIEEVKGELLSELTPVSFNFSRKLRNIHGAVKHITVQPVVQTVWASARRSRGDSNSSSNYSGSAEGNRSGAELYSGPQILYDLWQEYELCLSGKKPAK